MDVVGLARILGLEATLAEQNGVIRRDQARATGLTRNRVDDLVRRGRWVRALPAVYALPNPMGTIETSGTSFERLLPQSRIRAVWLWAGNDSVIGGDAAAWWLGLSPDPPETITVLVPPSRRLTGHPGVRVVRATVDRRDIRDHYWVRVTAPSRTCLDLARSARPDRLTDALRLRKVEQAELRRSLERSRGRRGQVRARTALREVATNPCGSGEKVAHRALIDAGDRRPPEP